MLFLKRALVSALSRFCVPVSCHMCGSLLGLSSFDSCRCNWRRWHPLRTRPLTGCSLPWSHPLGLSRQSLQWSRFCLPRPARVLPCLKLLPVLFSQRGPTGLSVKAAPRLLPTARSPPTAALASERGQCDQRDIALRLRLPCNVGILHRFIIR